MRKWIMYLVLGSAALGVGAFVVWRIARGQADPWAQEVLAAYREGAKYDGLTIGYPLDETLFPPEIAPPTFRWDDTGGGSNAWLVTFKFQDGARMSFRAGRTEWTPSDDQWELIKRRSVEKWAKVAILGVDGDAPDRILSGAEISVKTSADEVGAPLFFREVNLPFLTAVKDPAKYIRWRFGPISSKGPPPIVLEKLPVCGNCHSFSADGTTLAMEVDSGNDKGSYAIAPIEPQIVLDPTKIISWSDYRKEDNEKTFGLLCQVSPDGRYVVGTVKDRALAVYRPDLMFSQLFFLVKGILAIYDRQNGTFQALPGADDPRYVQTNATWSPDGKYIVFARGEVYNPPSLENVNSILVPPEAADEFVVKGKKFLYDLYRIPFNDGKGGKAEPIEGASQNGMSNYFAKYSPDAKWIVFCKAKSFMLLQPDSELYVIPAEGGKARRLRCNTPRMNSWHSWSPNGKWLVFSSKVNGPYTQLFLTHIDEEGRSSPAVVLSNFTEESRAANIPEFVNAHSNAIRGIYSQFLDDVSYCRVASEFYRAEDFAGAARAYEKALEFNPNNMNALVDLGESLLHLGRAGEAKPYLLKALQLQPDTKVAHVSLACVLVQERSFQEAAQHCRRALQIDPEYADAHFYLGTLLLQLGTFKEAKVHLTLAVRLDPKNAKAHFSLAGVFAREGERRLAAAHFDQGLELEPTYVPALLGLASIRAMSQDDTLRNGEEAVRLAAKACELTKGENLAALDILAVAYAEAGRFSEAIATAEKAIQQAQAEGKEAIAGAIGQRLQLYEQNKPFRVPEGP